MAWIRVDQTLPNHRKTLLAADALDVDPAQMVGHLVCFWMWAIDNAPHGDLSPYSARVVARAAQWFGDATAFLSALQDAGFLDEMQIHDWFEYAGKLIEQREKNAARMREERAKERAQADADACNARASHMQGTDDEPCDERSRAKTDRVNDYVNNKSKTDGLPAGAHTREAAAASNTEDPSVRLPSFDDDVAAIVRTWETATGTLPGEDYLRPLFDWLNRGMSAGAIVQAIEQAAEQKSAKNPPETIHVAYVESILRNWHNQGIHSDPDARRKRETDRIRGHPSKPNPDVIAAEALAMRKRAKQAGGPSP